jgi:hypothetical protein
MPVAVLGRDGAKSEVLKECFVGGVTCKPFVDATGTVSQDALLVETANGGGGGGGGGRRSIMAPKVVVFSSEGCMLWVSSISDCLG